MTGRTNHRARARALEAAARELESEAEKLRARAAVQSELSEHAARMEKIPEALRLIKVSIDRGDTESDAIAHAADVHELRADMLTAYWQTCARRSGQGTRWRRDREIMRLAWEGKTNAEIAALVRLSPGSVSRVIRGKIRAGALLGPILKENFPPRSSHTREMGSGGMSIPPAPFPRIANAQERKSP